MRQTSVPLVFATLFTTASGLAFALAAEFSFQPTPILEGHRGPVFSVAYSPDGKMLASAGGDATVRLWDVATGVERSVLKGRKKEVSAVAFSPDGSLLISGDDDGVLKLWEIAGNKEVGVLKNAIRIHSLSFSSDGKRLVVAAGSVSIWDLDKKVEIADLRGHEGVASAAISPSGLIIASGDDAGRIRIWDGRTYKQLEMFKAHSDGLNALAFSPDGRTLASASLDRTIRIWETATWKQRATLTGHTDWVTSVAISPNGSLLASASRDKTVRLYDLSQAGKSLAAVDAEVGEVWCVAFSPDGQTLAFGGSNGKIRVRRVADVVGKAK